VASISEGLMIKYGLSHKPTDDQTNTWLRRTRSNINIGIGREEAGERAAREIFTDYKTHFYSTEADTMETLLRIAEGK
jgi:hypothetical protein